MNNEQHLIAETAKEDLPQRMKDVAQLRHDFIQVTVEDRVGHVAANIFEMFQTYATAEELGSVPSSLKGSDVPFDWVTFSAKFDAYDAYKNLVGQKVFEEQTTTS